MNKSINNNARTAFVRNHWLMALIVMQPLLDIIAFWTKNPEPMLPYLKMIDLLGFPYYFEMTITDYGKDLEPNLPTMEESMATFLLLSERLGRDRVDWRFDPIILNDVYTLQYHTEKFEMMCEWLHKYTERCF